MSPTDFTLICDTCGHAEVKSRPMEEKQSLIGAYCDRPWCTGHYILVDRTTYRKPGSTWDSEVQEAIRTELFPLPTFDRAAYREECLLVQKEEADKAAFRAANPIPKCPKCGSVLTHKERRGFKLGRAIMGGYLAGSIGADDLVNKCETCGCIWK